jgi:hypothetical protein
MICYRTTRSLNVLSRRGFTYLFQLTSLKLQVFMTSGVVALIAHVLFPVIALSSPFRGAVRIGPEPFLEQLARIAAPSGS